MKIPTFTESIYTMKLLTPQQFDDYQLIDSGDYEKLERYGDYILRRPEPQAIWRKSLTSVQWDNLPHAYFKKSKEKPLSTEENERGKWILKPSMPQQWLICYRLREKLLRFRLGLTAFKHIGIFPEQACNWDYIFDTVQSIQHPETKILNLFAYTGAASMAAKAAGADVVHVDSVKQVLNWSRENMEASHLNNIRWVMEDVLKFVKRETKRRNKYQGIVLDPPAYGPN